MNKSIVSVIAPVYGVEKYIERAVKSLQEQTFTDWELFLVDDGSRDNSGAICDRLAASDERIIVIHKENGGAPSARNVAIDKACGKYMFFMDPDDWAEPRMLEDLVATAERDNAQLVVAGFYIDTYYSETEKFQQEQFVEDKKFETKEDFRKYAVEMFDASLLYPPWNKLVRADYILENKLYFPYTFWDDLPWNLSVIRDVERVSVISNKYYHFIRQRAESEGAKYRDNMFEKREEEQDWMEDLYSYWGLNSSAIDEFLSRRYIERLIGCIENVTNKNCSLTTHQKKKEIKKMISSERTRNALKVASPNSLYMKLMLVPLKMHCVSLTYLEGLVISKVKRSNTRVFAALKANR